MSQNLAHVEYGKVFLKSFRREVGQVRDEGLIEGARILRREEETSIRQRWFKLGRTLSSLKEEFVTEGERKSYRLIPTAMHAIFGEYGTGLRGRVTGQPAPRGWRYGNKPGMAARRYSRIAIAIARPQVEDVFKQKARELADRLTK